MRQISETPFATRVHAGLAGGMTKVGDGCGGIR